LAPVLRGGAAQLPPQFGVPAPPPCAPGTKPTPARRADGFEPNAPFSRTMAGESAPGSLALELTGFVIGLKCGPIAGAIVDVWTASGRVRQRTSAEGRFLFDRIVVPARQAVGPAVNLRVEVPGKTSLATTLFLPAALVPDGASRGASFDPLLEMSLAQGAVAGRPRACTFDVILDL
jgi:protocatechuate 3,4-dioxygenase beta subunit